MWKVPDVNYCENSQTDSLNTRSVLEAEEREAVCHSISFQLFMAASSHVKSTYPSPPMVTETIFEQVCIT